MTKAPKLQPRSVRANLDTILAGIEKSTIFRAEGTWAGLAKGGPSPRVGVEDAAVVNATVCSCLSQAFLPSLSWPRCFWSSRMRANLSASSVPISRNRVVDLWRTGCCTLLGCPASEGFESPGDVVPASRIELLEFAHRRISDVALGPVVALRGEDATVHM